MLHELSEQSWKGESHGEDLEADWFHFYPFSSRGKDTGTLQPGRLPFPMFQGNLQLRGACEAKLATGGGRQHSSALKGGSFFLLPPDLPSPGAAL